jgi:HlyD family secretion protein
MKTILGVVVAVVIAGLVAAHVWRTSFVERPQFRTLPVTRGDLFIGVTATGTVEPVEIIDVGAQIVGCIKSFGPDPDRPGKTIDYRSRVKEGAVLAQLDDLPHQAELDKARVNMKLAEAELSRYCAKQNQAERNLARAKQLRETESAESYENSQAEDKMAKAELAMAEARLEQAKIAAKQAEINLGYTTIRSPVNGVVIDRRVNVGQTVVAGMNAPSLFLLAKDLSHMLVWAAVNEADIGDIRVGQKVTFKVDAYRDQTFTGKVSQIRLNASLQQNVVTYGVVVDVNNTDGKLLPYMTAKLQFEVARRSNVVLVPNQALRWQPMWEQISFSDRDDFARPAPSEGRQETQKDGQIAQMEPKVAVASPTVWVVADDGLVRPVAVKVGLSDGIVTEIASEELEPGDAVVAHEVREAQPDFVSSFISHVTDTSK